LAGTLIPVTLSITTMKLSVPYYSQHLDVTDPYWQDRSCGIVCLKMALEYVHLAAKPPSEDRSALGGLAAKSSTTQVPTIDDLILEGAAIGGHDSEYGWIHDRLVSLAHNHGVPAYREEFRSLDITLGPDGRIQSKKEPGSYSPILIDLGIKKITETVHDGKPVIVSIIKNINGQDSFHMILIVGVSAAGFYCHDPDSRVREEGEGLFMDFEIFKNSWRRLAIFLY
jgi:Peptidase_C39 like family